MAEPGFLARHGILRNAIRADLLQFHLPFFGVFAVALVLSFRGGDLEGIWGTLWRVIRQPGSLLDLSPQKAIGLILFVGGLTVMLVGHITLWRNYSGFLVIKEGHQLIQHGIYRLVRHPIYLGLLVVIVGLPLYGSSLYGLLTMVVLIPILLNRIRLEEALLIEEFGDAYLSYRGRTRKLIPFVY
jgi:protein-S-isoprenylcysteine O-methyltransferase Ste14